MAWKRWPWWVHIKEISAFLRPGRLITWNLQITHLERNMIFQTSMIMFHVDLQGCMNFSLQVPCCLGGGNSNMFYVHPEIWGRWTHFDSYFSDGLKPPTSCCLVSVAVSLVLSGIWMFKKPFANDKSDDDQVPFLDIQMGLLDIHVFFSRKPPYSLVTSWSLMTIAHHWLISP